MGESMCAHVWLCVCIGWVDVGHIVKNWTVDLGDSTGKEFQNLPENGQERQVYN